MTNDHVTVLVVDDDDLTAEMIERSLRKFGPMFRIEAAIDGQEALDMLRGIGRPKLDRPHVVLLDLNMPRLNGFEFLEAIRSDPDLQDSVVFVLTTSDAQSDMARAYNEQVAGYIVKEAAGSQFTRVAAMLNEFNATVCLPA